MPPKFYPGNRSKVSGAATLGLSNKLLDILLATASKPVLGARKISSTGSVFAFFTTLASTVEHSGRNSVHQQTSIQISGAAFTDFQCYWRQTFLNLNYHRSDTYTVRTAEIDVDTNNASLEKALLDQKLPVGRNECTQHWQTIYVDRTKYEMAAGWGSSGDENIGNEKVAAIMHNG
ncbi:hypothetical protein WG66_000602 [Moniliophthora roreri]|nr:hypothetical protein WG66_000602 [Moniliophthora roreri]